MDGKTGTPILEGLYNQSAMSSDDSKPVPPTIGGRIRALRMAVDMTQADLAEAAGLKGRSSITGIENDKDYPGRKTSAAIAEFFGVSIDYILKGTSPPTSAPYKFQLVKDPDKLALLRYWDSLDEADRRVFLGMLKRPPL